MLYLPHWAITNYKNSCAKIPPQKRISISLLNFPLGGVIAKISISCIIYKMVVFYYTKTDQFYLIATFSAVIGIPALCESIIYLPTDPNNAIITIVFALFCFLASIYNLTTAEKGGIQIDKKEIIVYRGIPYRQLHYKRSDIKSYNFHELDTDVRGGGSFNPPTTTHGTGRHHNFSLSLFGKDNNIIGNIDLSDFDKQTIQQIKTEELLAERPERGGFFLGRAGRTRLRQVRRGRSCS